MNGRQGQQNQFCHIDERSVGMQMIHIRVEKIFPPINRKIADEMHHQETAETKAGDGHEQLFPDGGSDSVCKPVHFFPPLIKFFNQI